MDLAAQLKGEPRNRYGRTLKLEELFGDRPDILEAVIVARAERKLSYQSIADVLGREGEYISPTAVQNWLRAQGVQ
jgi:DNA-directed RNA polymerase specialized sigma24 family protein